MASMTTAQRAVACTATGQLSGRPKWEWLPGMLYTDGIGRVRRVLVTGSDGLLVVSVHFGADTIRLSSIGEAVPVLDDELTRLAVLALVRRGWKGHEVRVAFDRVEDSECAMDRHVGHVMKHRITIIASDGSRVFDCMLADLDALLVLALELAP